MTTITVSDLRAHIGGSANASDSELDALIQAVETWVAAIGVDLTGVVPSPVRSAILLGAAQLHALRGEPQIKKTVTQDIGSQEFDREASDRLLTATISRLIAPYREVTL
ncbi:head-tail connector protein [Oryzibacter oryziterrae]|uniref:head-tail connector protein n=1 Tax=Oryzibacter oryziterrae TaxID=2766474 RepID=UPI001F276C7B|nr:head-tail connector protein [Oryzibacter oryziterrae]